MTRAPVTPEGGCKFDRLISADEAMTQVRPLLLRTGATGSRATSPLSSAPTRRRGHADAHHRRDDAARRAAPAGLWRTVNMMQIDPEASLAPE